MAAIIKSEIGIDPTMIEGSGGVFDVTINGELVYSKAQTGKFPEDDEVVAFCQATA